MGSAVVTYGVKQDLGGGARLVTGNAALSCSYATGGETLDLSAALSGQVTVLCGATGLYAVKHDGGTAAAGKLGVLATSNGSLSQSFSEIASTTNVAALTVQFVAIGRKV